MSSKPFNDLSRTLRHLADTVEQVTIVGNTPSASCPAVAEMEDPTLEPAEWQGPAKSVLPVVTLLAHSVSQHIHAVATLMPVNNIIYPLQTNLRAVLEQSVIASFLAAPGIDAIERTRRYLNYKMAGLRQRETLVSGAGRKEEADLVRREIEAICSTAECAGLVVKKPQGRTPHIGGAMPPTTALVKTLVDSAAPTLGEISWRLLSAVQHGALPGLTQHITRISDHPTDADMFIGEIGASTGEIAIWTGAPVVATLELLDRLRTFTGQRRDRSQAEVNIGQVIDRLSSSL